MLIEIRKIEEVKQYSQVLPQAVIDEIMHGGYSLVAKSAEDVLTLRSYINYETRYPEWSNRLGNSGYLSALYVVNNDFTIKVIIPETFAPKFIKDSLED